MGGADLRALYPDFEISFKRYGHSQQVFHDLFSLSQADRAYYKLLKKLERIYQEDKNKTLSSQIKIPKNIHQIWLGGAIPEKYTEFIHSWKSLTGWKYHLWTDHELNQFNHPLLKHNTTLVEKADILRLEILYTHGGLYVDTDVMCLNASFFDFAHQQYSFYAGLEPIENYLLQPIDDFYLRCGTAVLGAKPKHPLIKKCLADIGNHFAEQTGKWPVTRSGPDFLTCVIDKDIKLLGNDGMIFPPTSFYPLSYKMEEAAVAKLHIRDETACVHYFDISWQ